ncbi:MAG TPA: transglycosylase domain-containing protein, partial [Thermoanaerobaculia bacterium]|nr:transglycosylase domain-containing protein [Thermoanaerobaculia bacterium]
MTEFPNQPSPRKQILKYFALALLAFLVMLLLAGVFVYFQAVRRFEVRRVSLPTRIYADLFPLRPGVYVSAPALMGKLRRLGYREIDETPGEPGEYAEEGKEIDIFLRAFEHPAGEFAAQRVRVVFVERSIESVISVPEGEPVETAALEPELLTSILGDQLESRTPVNLEQIPQHLVDAVISTEDARFFHHPGVDPIGILRAALRNVRARGVSEGGSTLTQQLVKNYYLTNERTLRRKVVEAFMAVVLDYRYSKEEILESYMNDIYLGRDRSISILGMGQAARFYFGKPISEVAIGEAALLAGIIRSPNNYSPFDEPEEARQRRNQVLDLMLGREKITREQYDQARAEPLPESPTRERTGLGSIPFYVNAVLEELERDYGIEDARGR